MTTPKLVNRKAIKIRFFVLYTLSVVLVLVLFASFTRGNDANNGKALISSSAAATRVAIDNLLHERLEKLEAVRTQYSKDTSAAATDAIETEKASFLAAIDSVRKATSLADANEKGDIEALLTSFSRSAESGIVVLKDNSSDNAGKGGATKEEMDELKEILAQKEQKIADLEKATQGTQGSQALLKEKDKTIASLQNKITSLQTQLTQQPKSVQSVSGNDAGAAEWRDKYNKIKAANDQLQSTNQRYETQANALKNSYKEVLEDNKRLASQVQALKAGKG